MSAIFIWGTTEGPLCYLYRWRGDTEDRQNTRGAFVCLNTIHIPSRHIRKTNLVPPTFFLFPLCVIRLRELSNRISKSFLSHLQSCKLGWELWRNKSKCMSIYVRIQNQECGTHMPEWMTHVFDKMFWDEFQRMLTMICKLPQIYIP